MEPLLLVAGLLLLAASLWWRTSPGPGRRRWWLRSEVDTYAALLVFPGIALGLVSAWPIVSYDPALADLGGESWKLWFVLPAALGLLLAAWGMLWLPVPRWFQPRWARDELARARRSRRRRPRGPSGPRVDA